MSIMGTQKRERQKANRAQKVASQAAQQKHDQRKRSVTGLLVVLGAVIAVGLVLWLGSSGDDKKTASTTTAPPTTASADLVATPFKFGTTACPPEGGSTKPVLTFQDAPKNCLTKGKQYQAIFTTTAGDVVVELDTDKTPGTSNNFVFLARNRYFDGTKLFRADASIDIVQGGSPHTQSNSDPGPGYTIPDEGKFNADSSRGEYTYKPGDLAMARTSEANSASGQFFFVTGPNAAAGLNNQGTYVVFGKTIKGIEIMQKIVAGVADKGTDIPDPEVTVTKVTITERS